MLGYDIIIKSRLPCECGIDTSTLARDGRFELPDDFCQAAIVMTITIHIINMFPDAYATMIIYRIIVY